MKKSVLLFLPFLITVIILYSGSCKNPGPGEDAFLGDWYVVKGDVDVYSFMKDNNSFIFSGTQEQRPVVYGNWKVDRDKFVIIVDDGTTTTYNYSLVNDTLVFNGGEEIYTKIPPLEIQFPEVQILKDLVSDFSSHKFSEPMPVELIWNQWTDSTQSLERLLLKGYAISMGSSLLSDDMENLSGYLYDHGFIRDTLFVTETCNGFWDGNQVVTICIYQDAEPNNDSINILVSSAINK